MRSLKPIRGKVVVVTGAGRGIGQSIAEQAAELGAHVAVCARSADEFNQVASGINGAGGKAIAVVLDVANPESVQKAFAQIKQELGPVDILVNNAGVMHIAPLHELPLDQWNDMWNVNVTGAYLCCQAVIPDMAARKTGHIINIGSQSGRRGYALQSGYCASKHALAGFTKVLAIEMQAHNVRVNLISPGGAVTKLSEPLRQSRGSASDEEWMTADEVADLVIFLMGQQSGAAYDEIPMRRTAAEPFRQ